MKQHLKQRRRIFKRAAEKLKLGKRKTRRGMYNDQKLKLKFGQPHYFYGI